LLGFSRSKWVGIERPDKDTFLAYGILEDNIYGMEIDVKVEMPDFKITGIEGKMRRVTTPECPKAVPVLKNAIGMCLTSPDFASAVNKKVGREGCRHFANLLLECCDAVIRCAVYEAWPEMKKKKPAMDKKEYLRKRLHDIPGLECLAAGQLEEAAGDY